MILVIYLMDMIIHQHLILPGLRKNFVFEYEFDVLPLTFCHALPLSDCVFKQFYMGQAVKEQVCYFALFCFVLFHPASTRLCCFLIFLFVFFFFAFNFLVLHMMHYHLHQTVILY